MFELAFVAAIVVLLISIIFAIKYLRKNINTAIRILGGGVLITCFILILPTDTVSNSFFNSLQAATLDANYDDLLKISITCNNKLFKEIYKILFLSICIVSPIMLGGFISTLAEGLWEKITYNIIKNFRDVYYFSELNKKSIMLASDIRKKYPKAVIVFCNYDKNGDVRHIASAQKISAYFLSDSETSFIIETKYKKYYFEISENQDLNLESARELLMIYRDIPNQIKNIEVFLFSECQEAEIIMNSTDKRGITLNIINEKKLIAYDLLFHKPLFENIKDNTISLLIVGTSTVAFEILKAAVWCGQLGDDYKLKINYIDKDALYYKSVLEKECPELINGNYDLRFLDCDTKTSNLDETVSRYCMDTTYIVLAGENDEENIENALYFRSFFIRTSPKFNNEPVIAAYINNTIKFNMCREFTAISRERIEKKGWDFSSEKSQNYNIYPFGADNYVYSCDFMMDSDIKKMSLNCHAVYELAFSENKATTDEIITSYNVSETNKRSSRANAVRIKYKLFLCGFKMEEGNEADNEADIVSYDELKARLSEKETLAKLSYVEHECWNAFMRSEGYRGVGIDEARIYKERTNNHKYIRAKIHACICDWKELDEVSAEFDPLFKKYDEGFIEKIPDILGINPDSLINICGVSYHIFKNN